MGGRILLRQEDLDRSRVRPEFERGVVEDLSWLGLDWDGPVLSQSSRLAAMREQAESLVDRGLAYPCVCRRSELAGALAAPHAGQLEARYSGRCRGRFASVAQARAHAGREPAIRLSAGESGPTEFEDGIVGTRRVDVAREVGDFVILNRAGVPSYQLAVVLDDAQQGVTEVVRGDDLLSSTARQILVYRAIGAPPPRFFHLPLVVDGSGRRLAKRSDDVSLRRLRQAGVAPEAVLGWIAESLGLGLPRRVKACELSAHFSVAACRGAVCSVGEDIALRLAGRGAGEAAAEPPAGSGEPDSIDEGR